MVSLQLFFEDNVDDDKYCGHLFGLGTSHVQNGANSTYEGYGPSTGHGHVVNAPQNQASHMYQIPSAGGDGSAVGT